MGPGLDNLIDSWSFVLIRGYIIYNSIKSHEMRYFSNFRIPTSAFEIKFYFISIVSPLWGTTTG